MRNFKHVGSLKCAAAIQSVHVYARKYLVKYLEPLMAANHILWVCRGMTSCESVHACVQDYLVKWPKTLMVVSHARDFLNVVCTDILHLHSRKLTSYKRDFDTFEKTAAESVH